MEIEAVLRDVFLADADAEALIQERLLEPQLCDSDRLIAKRQGIQGCSGRTKLSN